MIVWLSLVVALVSSLVACLSKLKEPEDVRRWSRPFLEANRLVVLSAFLAFLGFVVAGLGVRQDKMKAENKRLELQAENRVLQSLLLHGKSVAPAISLILETGNPNLESGLFEERSAWRASAAMSELPKTLGFISSEFRKELFPAAQPEDLPRFLGDVDIKTGRSEWRFNFRVRDDGTVKAGTSPFSYEEVRMDVLDGSRGGLFLKTKQRLDCLGLYHAVVRGYEEGKVPLRFRSWGATEGISEKVFSQRRGRVRFFLDETGQISVTAMLQGDKVRVADGQVYYDWRFSEPPHLDVSLPGGRK